MRKSIFLILVALSILVLILRFGIKPLTNLLGYQQKAGVKITSTPQALVSINGREVGTTPYQDESLQAGEYNIRLSVNKASWAGWVKLNKGTLTVVNRELAENVASSSGEVLTLTAGYGANITSAPSSAEVTINGKPFGQTPLAIANLTSGEHNFLISHDNYLKRSIRAFVPEKYALNLEVDLAISELDLTAVTVPSALTSTKLIIKTTPTGFLRVRDQPSLKGKELTRAPSGSQLEIVEEVRDWFKVKLPDGQEGYVLAAYVEKKGNSTLPDNR